MSSTVLKLRVTRSAVLTLLCAGAATNTALASPADTGASVVVRLYKDFAWQAFTVQDEFGATMTQQPTAVLERYFSSELAGLLAKDQQCVTRSKEVCNLDFDPLFASQDPGASDLSIHPIAPGKIAVSFVYPASSEKITLLYSVAMKAGKWRVTDVIYPREEGTSLKRILMRKLR